MFIISLFLHRVILSLVVIIELFLLNSIQLELNVTKDVILDNSRIVL